MKDHFSNYEIPINIQFINRFKTLFRAVSSWDRGPGVKSPINIKSGYNLWSILHDKCRQLLGHLYLSPSEEILETYL